ncbi:unnamed protein product [Fusarium graminearum]|nr:hypothetical protein FG05_06323 [Fusarium graminearum]CZS85115.1 unnamed protein product [Fusarium graminearum]
MMKSTTLANTKAVHTDGAIMETLHEDLFRDVDAEDEADLYDQVPDSSCTGPRKSCARCQELGRRCYRCRRNKNTRIDETPPKKSSLELILGSAASRRRSPIDETPREPTRTTKDTPTRARPQEATRDTRTTYSERTYTCHSTYCSEYDSWSRSTTRASTEGRAGQNVDMRPVDAGAAAILAPDLAIVTIGMQKNLSAVRVIVDQMFSSRSSKPVPAGNYSQQNAMLRSLRKVVVPITMSTDTWEDRSRILRAATLAGGYLPRTSHSKMSR